MLYRDRIQSGCGNAQASTGPFYCPEDQKVYLDLGFFDELKRRFGAPGEFAQAYVIAHELGHHVQNLVGTERKVEGALQSGDKATRNATSVKLELQADCYAGVWGHTTEQRNIVHEQRRATSPCRRCLGRRRPPGETGWPSGQPRIVHPRLVGRPPEVVQPGPQHRRSRACNTFGQ